MAALKKRDPEEAATACRRHVANAADAALWRTA
jgi:DNA-binding GntR family transcriptional regulator